MRRSDRTELRLLVVEDESLLAMELEDMLEDMGHRVLGVAVTVESALRLIEELGDQLQGVLLDANLGGRSAYPVAESLQALRVPYVIASGYAAEEIQRMGLAAARIHKPYRQDEIESALDGFASPDAGR